MKKLSVLFVLILNVLLLSAQQPSFRFAVISDTHISSENKQNSDDLNSVIADINAQQGIAFVLVTGDITDKGDLKSLTEAKKMLSKLNAPFYVVAGNRDTKNTDDFGINFKRVFGDNKFRHSLNGFFFLGLSSGQYQNAQEGHFSAQDIEWLKRTLKNIGKKRPVFFVTHHPLKTGDVDNWFEVTDILRQHNTQAAISGHYHKNLVLNYDGIAGILNTTTLRNEENSAHYNIYEMADSLYVYDKKIGEAAEKWFALAVEQKFHPNTDSKNFPRPNFDVNREYKNVKEVWLKRLPTNTYANPIVHNGLMYFGSETGEFYCFDIKNGKQKWTFRAMDKIVGSAVAVDDKLIFGSTDRNVYCLDANTGKLIWKYLYKYAIFTDMCIYEDVVLLFTIDDVTELKISDGTINPVIVIEHTKGSGEYYNYTENHKDFVDKHNLGKGELFYDESFFIFLSENGVISFIDENENILAKRKIGNTSFNRPVKVGERDYVFTTTSGYVGRIIF
ncbi:MAG: metallophosphoesterase [Bacteroidetes bacterium]|nr:metallophosphoesterase [Bacteroidota bacterium]